MRDKEPKFLGWCKYCKGEVYDDEGYICINGDYYHYDKTNRYLNCYFPEEGIEELDFGE